MRLSGPSPAGPALAREEVAAISDRYPAAVVLTGGRANAAGLDPAGETTGASFVCLGAG